MSSLADSKQCSDGKKIGNANIFIGVGVGVGALCLLLVVVGVLWRKNYFKGKFGRQKGEYYYVILKLVHSICCKFFWATQNKFEL